MGEKRPTDHMEPAAKKRGNDRQITKDDASEDDEQVGSSANFQPNSISITNCCHKFLISLSNHSPYSSAFTANRSR